MLGGSTCWSGGSRAVWCLASACPRLAVIGLGVPLELVRKLCGAAPEGAAAARFRSPARGPMPVVCSLGRCGLPGVVLLPAPAGMDPPRPQPRPRTNGPVHRRGHRGRGAVVAGRARGASSGPRGGTPLVRGVPLRPAPRCSDGDQADESALAGGESSSVESMRNVVCAASAGPARTTWWRPSLAYTTPRRRDEFQGLTDGGPSVWAPLCAAADWNEPLGT